MISGTLDDVKIITVISCDKQLKIKFGVSAIVYLIYRFYPFLYHSIIGQKRNIDHKTFM